MKRMVAFVLTIAMLMSLLTFTAFAAGPVVKLSSSNGAPTAGEEFTVTVSISETTSGVTALDFDVVYGENLTVVSSAVGAAGSVLDETLTNNYLNQNKFRYSASAVDFDNGDTVPAGDLVTITFKVNASVEGVAAIPTLTIGTFVDNNFSNITHETKAEIYSANISITKPVKGATPQADIADGTGYTGTITWEPNHAQFGASTEYTATVELTAKEGYQFASSAYVADITDASIAGFFISADGSKLTFEATFEATDGADALGGTVTINGTPKFGEKLTFTENLDFGSEDEDAVVLSYQWKRGNIVVGTELSYVPVAEDIGKTITVSVTSSVNSGSVTSAGVVIGKADYAGADPAVPTLDSKTDTTITIQSTDGYEYVCNSENMAPANGWSTTTTFDGLTANTKYYIFARVAATATHEASAASTALEVTTDKPSTPITINASEDIIYDGAAVEYGEGKELSYTYAGDGAVAVKFYADNDGTRGTVLDSAPINAGTYWIGVSAAEGTNYAAAEEVFEKFTIAKAEQQITGRHITVKVGKTADLSDFSAQGELSFEASGNSATIEDKTLTAGNTAGTYSLIVTAAATDNYNSKTVGFDLIITAKDTQTITAEDVTATYGDTGKKITASGIANGGALSYAVKSGADVVSVDAQGNLTILKAGTAVVTVTAAETTDFAAATKDVTVTVDPKEITPVIAVTGTYTYDDGKAITPTYTVTFGQEETLAAAEYDVKVTDNVDAGTAKITVTDKEGGNYTFAEIEETFEIGKAPAKTLADKNTSVKFTATGAQTYALTGLGEDIEGYSGTGLNDADAIIASWSVDNGTVTYTLSDKAAAGKSATLTVTVSYKNYEDSTVNVVITLTDKDPSGSSVDSAFTKTYDGKAVTFADIHAAAKVAGTWAWAEGTVAPVNAQTATEYTLVFTPTDTANYATEEQKVSITINKATITVKADDIVIKVNETVPAATYTVTGLVNGETLEGVTAAIEGTVDNTKEGEYTIKVTGPETLSDNYNAIAYVDGKLTISNKNTVITPVGPKPQQPTQPEEPEVTPSFGDVAGEWFEADVEYVAEKGLMNGVGDGSMFAPLMNTTRGMIVTILWRMEGQPVPMTANTFKDVEKGAYYEQAVAWAAEKGIVNGYGDTFGPNDNITREQFATILFRYAQFKGYDVSVGEDTNILSYADAFSVSEYAIPAMQWACGAGLINGIGDTLQPAGAASRAQAAAILHRFCENVIQ